MGDDVFKVTQWWSTLGIGDGHDFATRGYLGALMEVGYSGLRIPPGITTTLLRMDKEMEHFEGLLRPDPAVRMKPLKLVEAGDPRIGTKRVIESKDDHGNTTETEVLITEGSIDLDVEQQYTSSVRQEVRCVVIHHDPASICRHFTNFTKQGRPEGVAYVGLTVWEASEIPEAVAMVLSELDMIIVPSEHAKKAFVTSGVSCPIRVVPHCYDPIHWPEPTDDEMDRVEEHERYVFYSIATPIERKNLTGLMEGYFRAFEGRDDVVLRIKSSADKSQLVEMAKAAVEKAGIDKSKRPALKFFTKKWSIEKIRAFHLDGDCYVSATRGEGFGLCEMEARLCGSRVITTSWGAAPEVLLTEREFKNADGDCVSLVPSIEVPVFNMQGIGCYEPDQKWAEPSIEALAGCMRWAAGRGLAVTDEMRRGWDSINTRFNPKVVGYQLMKALEEAQAMAMEAADDEEGF